MGEEENKIYLKEIPAEDGSNRVKSIDSSSEILLREIPNQRHNESLEITKKMWLSLLVSALLIPFMFVMIPYLSGSDDLTIQDCNANIDSFKMSHIEGSTHYFLFKIELNNPTKRNYTIEDVEADLYIKNISLTQVNPEWKIIQKNLYINKTYFVDKETHVMIDLIMPVTADDESTISFLSLCLMHKNHTIRLYGNFSLSIEDPDCLCVDIEKRAKNLFNYELTDEKSTHLLINNDLLSIPVEPPDTTTNITYRCKYVNNFSFNVIINHLEFDLTNSSGYIFAHHEISGVPINLAPNEYINISVMTNPEKQELTRILSDLLSGVEDLFCMDNLSVEFAIGNLLIDGFTDHEIVKSDIESSLEIVGFTIFPITLDFELNNTCGVDFNVTYIDITAYLAGTDDKAIWYNDTVDKPPYDYVPIPRYSSTILENMAVGYNLGNALAALDEGENVDLIGYLTCDCYQYEDDVPFISLDVEV
ncbi:MAG: hypothetical protein GF364_12300 [Candidatus Lokiarchaeota archaeon]|nr:hypothetical protein [Candidatus Lokiarchaeota archaeon]